MEMSGDHGTHSASVLLLPLECENHAVCARSYETRLPWLQGKGARGKSPISTSVIKDSEGKLFYCPHCPKKYSARGNLKQHIKNAHVVTEKKFTCEYCGKKFRLRCFLSVHRRNHTNERFLQSLLKYFPY